MKPHPDVTAAAEPARTKVRLDRWLWAVRLFKTRELAGTAIAAGQVRVGGERVKPARALTPGDRVSVKRAGLLWEAEVVETIERRVGAAEAAKAWREDPAVTAARETELAARRAAAQARPAGRPTKRDRRALDDFLNEP